MPDDIYFGRDCECRIGVMADASTDPTEWSYLEFLTLKITPTQDRKERPLLGRALHNKLDPMSPRKGLFKLAAELTVDADSRGLPLVLRHAFGAPATTGPTETIYTHVWESGKTAAVYFALQVKTADNAVRIFRGLTGTAISLDGKGDQVSDYDISISLKGLTRTRATAFIGDAPPALYSPSPAQRALFVMNGTAATRINSATWQWERPVTEDAFLSSTPALSALTPDQGGTHSGQVNIRAIGADFDTIEEGDTDFAAGVEFVGLATGHDVLFEHPTALMNPGAVDINGPGELERTFSWNGHQTTTSPASRITVKNDVESYA